MKLSSLHLLILLLIGFGRAIHPGKHRVSAPPAHPDIPPILAATSLTNSTTTARLPAPITPEPISEPKLEDDYLDLKGECMTKGFSNLSCQKMFCPPWMRCINGECLCKVPYQCPKVGSRVCGSDGRSYLSFCQLKAVGCKKNTWFSHIGSDCKGDKFAADVFGDENVVQVTRAGETLLVCGDGWNIPAANALCRSMGTDKGAETAPTVQSMDLTIPALLEKCVHVVCTGAESTLAECTFHSLKEVHPETMVAAVSCYKRTTDCSAAEFKCVNGKCIKFNHTCDGLNDCGDHSDEVCCKACRAGFHCKSGVCISLDALQDGVTDCLGAEDEYPPPEDEDTPFQARAGFSDVPQLKIPVQETHILATTKNETQASKLALSSVVCGISKAEHSRKKRLLGGKVATKGQIPWQVAIEDEGQIHCGGVYIGGCWVLTAAHCVRPKPELYRVKVGVWHTLKIDQDTDSLAVKKVIVHPQYDASSYQNDIALIEVKNSYNIPECVERTSSTGPVCVPWSEYQFQPGDKCVISGWGRGQEYKMIYTLNWANISIIGNCSGLYGHRYYEGMECAGNLDGSVDSCQGDSGGPLVCKDASGRAYVWGIVSWGDKCGVKGHPGVYTKVAHYFDWISFHVGRDLISRHNI
ncbi:complement factor I [Amia ocellicauda]|uniref:complement factor I n=1 Tax=Amia ocellicauda TaxID=2972642 RepID=UPI003463B7A8|nr:CFAI factor [Amia calva]